MATKKSNYETMGTKELREKLRRKCYEKVLDFLESDGLVEVDDAKMGVQALSVLAKEDGTDLHRDVLNFTMTQTIGPKQIEGAKQKKDAA